MNRYELAQHLVDRGIGNRWFKHTGLDRLYVDQEAMLEFAQLKLPGESKRPDGCGALRGERINPDLAWKLYAALASTKIYLDLTTGRWHIQLRLADLDTAGTVWGVVDQVLETARALEGAHRKRTPLVALGRGALQRLTTLG